MTLLFPSFTPSSTAVVLHYISCFACCLMLFCEWIFDQMLNWYCIHSCVIVPCSLTRYFSDRCFQISMRKIYAREHFLLRWNYIFCARSLFYGEFMYTYLNKIITSSFFRWNYMGLITDGSSKGIFDIHLSLWHHHDNTIFPIFVRV